MDLYKPYTMKDVHDASNQEKFKVISTFANHDVEKLLLLKRLVEEGKLKSVIDRVYPFNEVSAAHSYVEKGHKKGNVVLTIAH